LLSLYSLRYDGVELVHERVGAYANAHARCYKSDFGLTDFKTAQILKLDRDENQAWRLRAIPRGENQSAIF
jgi:hypothetical protein